MDRRTVAVYEMRAEEWARARPARELDRARSLQGRRHPGGPCADLGCGPGGYLEALAPAVGLDASAALLDLARSAAPGVPLVRGDLEHLPFRAGSLGGAWARASYHHLPRSRLPLALADLHAALAADAPVELSVRSGAGEGPLAGDDFPGRLFTEWDGPALADLVTGAGFDVGSAETSGDWVVVAARRARTLADTVGAGMRLLVCGLNPSLTAADAGYGYAGRGNRFWPALIRAGLIDAAAARRPGLVLSRHAIGMTDLVKRATPKAQDVHPAEYRAGLGRLERLVGWLQPGLVLMVGLHGWRLAAAPQAVPGLQQQTLAGRPVVAMPSTSGLNTHCTLADLVDHLASAARNAG